MADPTPSSTDPAEAVGADQPAASERIFLVVVDETEEMRNALHFACRRSEHTGGRVAMLYVIEPPEFQHWLGVERVMQDEAREQAEQTLQELAAKVQAMTGQMPILIIREGRRHEEVLALLGEEPSISIVVLGTAPGRQDPGPLVNYLVSRMGDKNRVPLTLVPGQLTEEEIDQLA